MQGLKYLADEIKFWRHLLHDFVRDAASLQEMVIKAILFPHEYKYIENGKLEFILPPRCIVHPDPKRPELTVESGFKTFEGLTLTALAPHLPAFFKNGELVVIPIKTNAVPPNGYELVNLALGFFLTNKDQGAYIFSRLKSNDGRVFKIYVRHDRIPADYKESGQYRSYKRIVRRVGNLTNERQQLIPYRVQIDEKTNPGIIWTQLLLCAVNQGFLSLNDEKVYEELSTTLSHIKRQRIPVKIDGDIFWHNPPQVDDWIRHMERYRSYPYTPQSTPAYLKRVMKGYTKKAQEAESGGLTTIRGDVESLRALRVVDTSGIKGSVPFAAKTLHIPERTIYYWIKNGKICSTLNSDGIIIMSDNAINKIRQLIYTKRKLQDGKILALKAGKSRSAIKKYFQRNKNPSDDDFRRWLRFSRRNI